MVPLQHVFFPPFRLDLVEERIWCDEKEVVLRRKPFALLRHLVEHAGQVLTKEDLLDAVWSDVQVGEGVLAVDIRELRKALGDDSKAPRFIETIHGKGYRFIAPLTTLPVAGSQYSVPSSPPFQPIPNFQPLTPSFVGREMELAQLHRWLDKALSGERRIVFVAGEPGIGKTSVVESFVERVAARAGVWIGRGQCIEQYGAGEAYLPVLEILGQLWRTPESEPLRGVLKRYAPTWLAQMRALMGETEGEKLRQEAVGASRERMLHEFAEAVEAVTARQPLLLVLEDLHWSDYSTLDALSTLARRREQARLLLLGTYRPVEIMARNHPFLVVKQELELHRHCEELQLGGLHEGAVAEYLEGCFPVGTRNAVPLRRLVQVVHRHTEGNPLFMVNVVGDLQARGIEIRHETAWQLWSEAPDVAVKAPANIRQMIERQVGRLTTAEQRLLETASVAGMEFSAAAVATGLDKDVVEVEETCAGLVRREQFLREGGSGEWPDGVVAARYTFRHALYQEVLYERVTAGRRVQLHHRLGERLEKAYGERGEEIAAELATHFERGRDYGRATRYLRLAGEKALRRYAHREAIDHLSKGLEFLQALPDTRDRARQELALQMALGPAWVAAQGWGAAGVGSAYARARELCRQIGNTPQLAPVLYGLWTFYVLRAEHRTGRELAEQLLNLSQKGEDPILALGAHGAMGVSLLFFGEFATVRRHLERGIALYDPQKHRDLLFQYTGLDPAILSLSVSPLTLWMLGYPDQALKRSQEALTWAHDLAHPFNLVYALHFAALLHQLRRDEKQVLERTQTSIAISREQDFALFSAWGEILQGWALVEQGQAEGGVERILRGLDSWRATGAALWEPHSFALLAEVYEKAGQGEKALAALSDALRVIQATGERLYEAELYRLKGTLTLQSQASLEQVSDKPQPGPKSKVQGPKSSNPKSEISNPKSQEEAEACFLTAIEIARKQQAKSLELRATTSLARLWRQQGKKNQAHKVLAKIYGWFTEGLDTKDLREAKALLEELT